MIQAINVHLSFNVRRWMRNERVSVLSGFSMVAPSGQSTGLIGANGAGKTSFFRACAGLCRLDLGQVLVDGVDPAREPERARRLISLLPEKPSIPPEWSGLDALDGGAIHKGMFGAAARSAIEREVERWGLEPFMERPSGGYSRGQLARVALAREALLPLDNIVLDEPTAALDFKSAGIVRSWARELVGQGRCVVLSTHIVSEIGAMCQSVVGLQGGVAHTEAEAWRWVEQAEQAEQAAHAAHAAHSEPGAIHEHP